MITYKYIYMHEGLGVSRWGMGQWWPAAGLGVLTVAVHAWDLLKEVAIIFITSTIVYCYCCEVTSVVSDSVWPHRQPPTRLPVPGILQARTVEWVAISFSNAWKWKVKVKSLSRVRPQRPHGLQPSRLLHPWDFPGRSPGVGCTPVTTIVWPQVNSREGTQLHPSTENRIKDLLSMVSLIRTRLIFPLSQSFPSGSFHKALILLHQRDDRLKTTITEN